LYPARDKIAGM